MTASAPTTITKSGRTRPRGGHVRRYFPYTTPSDNLTLAIAWDGTEADFSVQHNSTYIDYRTETTAGDPTEIDQYSEFLFFGGTSGTIDRWTNRVETWP